MPLQNRVSPFGEIVATPERGGFMGNRGILHDENGRLGNKRWALKGWVCCLLEFKGRRRPLVTPGTYTELFFLDEPTALAAGHRPCAECRRVDYNRFLDAWEKAHGGRPSAARLNDRLHRDRVAGRAQRRHAAEVAGLPDGAMIVRPGDETNAWLVRGDRLHRWSFGGYVEAIARPSSGHVTVLTPACTVATLAAGYRPVVRETAAGGLSRFSPRRR